MHRTLAALLCLPLAAQAQTDDTPVGGVGRLACAQVTGPENAPYLGQVADWALGYLAGRIDAGQTPTDATALSPDDTIDVITGIATRCRETPGQPVIDAVRDFAENVLGEAAQGGEVTADPPPPEPDLPDSAESRDQSAPPPRPEDLEPAEDAAAEDDA